MRNDLIVRSNASQPVHFRSSGAIVATTTPALRISTAEGALIGTARAVLLRSDRVGRLPPISTATRPTLSTGTRSQLWVGGLAATRMLPPAVPAAAATGATAPIGRPSGEPASPSQGEPTIAAAAVRPAKPSRIEMTIDSLPNYDLLQPIPVVIEALGERLFSAEAPDLEISTTGASIGGSFLQLKEQIAATYEQCRQKSTLSPERLHQLGLFQAYIGRAKRGWPLGRG
jgi:hypothetical protein